jgi:hypothetical protein
MWKYLKCKKTPLKPRNSRISSRYLTFSPLCRDKAPFLLDVPVQIVTIGGHVRRRVLSHEVDLVLFHELVGDLPRRVADDLVHIATVADRLKALDVCHHRPALERVCDFIVAGTNNKIDLRVGENVLGLHHLSGVSLVEEVVNAVGVDADLAGASAVAGHVEGDSVCVVACLAFSDGFRVCRVRRWLANCLERRKNKQS